MPNQKENMNDPQAFPITTLRDIFNLPTFRQMETCLRETMEGMIQARLANDVMVAAMEGAGTKVERAIEWPEVVKWTDDGKGDVKTSYGGPDGVPLFSLQTTVKPDSSGD